MGIVNTLMDVLICHEEAQARTTRELVLLVGECRPRGIEIQIITRGPETVETQEDRLARLLLRRMPIDLHQELKLLTACARLPREITMRPQCPRQNTAQILRRNSTLRPARFMFRSRGGKM